MISLHVEKQCSSPLRNPNLETLTDSYIFACWGVGVGVRGGGGGGGGGGHYVTAYELAQLHRL